MYRWERETTIENLNLEDMGAKQNDLGLRPQSQLMCNMVKNYAASKAQPLLEEVFQTGNL